MKAKVRLRLRVRVRVRVREMLEIRVICWRHHRVRVNLLGRSVANALGVV